MKRVAKNGTFSICSHLLEHVQLVLLTYLLIKGLVQLFYIFYPSPLQVVVLNVGKKFSRAGKIVKNMF